MQPNRKMVLTLLLGIVIGTGSVTVLQAQHATAVRAYVIAEIDVTDPAAYQRYAAQVPPTLAPFKAEYLVRGGNTQRLEGSPPAKRVVVLAFDSMEKAQAWYDSPAYSGIKPIRQAAAKTRSFIVEGVAESP